MPLSLHTCGWPMNDLQPCVSSAYHSCLSTSGMIAFISVKPVCESLSSKKMEIWTMIKLCVKLENSATEAKGNESICIWWREDGGCSRVFEWLSRFFAGRDFSEVYESSGHQLSKISLSRFHCDLWILRRCLACAFEMIAACGARFSEQWKLLPLAWQRAGSQVHPCAKIFGEKAGCLHTHLIYTTGILFISKA